MLIAVLAFDLEHKRSAVGQTNQEVWNVAALGAVPHVVDLEPKMIILRIGFNEWARFEQIGDVLLPRAVGQHVADLRAHRRVTDLSRVPGAHLPCAAYGEFFVEDRLHPFEVLFSDEPEQMLHDAVDAERNQDPLAKWILMKQARNRELLRGEERFEQANELNDQQLLATGETAAEVLERLACR